MGIDPRLSLFTGDTGGIDSWLTSDNSELIFNRLAKMPGHPLSHSLLNQLLALSHQPPVSRPFFDYYWCSTPTHPYRVDQVPGYHETYTKYDRIESIDQLSWGLYRIYVDCLLYFGSIRNGFFVLRDKNGADILEFFKSKMFDPQSLIARGEPISPIPIQIDDRYLIGELACKSFEPPGEERDMWYALYGAWVEHQQRAGGKITYKELLDSACLKPEYASRQMEFTFATDELLTEIVDNEDQLKNRYDAVKGRFSHARQGALKNTDLYVSMSDDLDVYVATSMRAREQFREMARICEVIFNDPSIKHYNLRYFDPTLSAARGHEDKGLIECLMVKCAKVLIYMAGAGDSYGKDVEAAMALSQGKPVIFYCDADRRLKLFQDIHPLSRLVDSSGVAVGLMATSKIDDIIIILHRIFGNEMRYELEHRQNGNFRLVESLTRSVVRVQTGDKLLRETFWHSYHS